MRGVEAALASPFASGVFELRDKLDPFLRQLPPPLAFVELLRRHAIALVAADTARKWPLMEDVTADFVYVRLHGDEKIYESGHMR